MESNWYICYDIIMFIVIFFFTLLCSLIILKKFLNKKEIILFFFIYKKIKFKVFANKKSTPSDLIVNLNNYLRNYCDDLLSSEHLIFFFDNKFFTVSILNKCRKHGFLVFNNVTQWVLNIKTLNSKLKAIQKQKDLFFQIINNAPYLIWLRDEKYNIIFFNAQYSNIIEQRTIFTDGIGADILELNNDKNNFNINNNLRNKYTATVNINNTIQKIQIQEKIITNALCIAGYGHNVNYVTNHYNNTNQKYDNIYRTLLQHLPSAIVIYNNRQELVFFNRAFLKIWKVDDSFLRNKPSYGEILNHLREINMLPEQIDFQEFKKKELDLFTNLTDIYNNFYYLPNRQIIHFTAIPHPNGELLFIYDDITDHIILEQNYNTSIKTHYTTLNHLHEGICVYGFDGKLKLYNNSFVKMWSIPKNHLENHPHINKVISYMHEYNNIEKLDSQKMMENITNNVPYEEVIKKSDKTIHVQVVPLPDSSSLVKYQDITAQKIIESNLKDENKNLLQLANIKSKFFASISYEIKTPITSIQGFSEMILNNMCGEITNKQRNYLQNIYDETSMLDNMVNNILYINSIEAGVYNIHKNEYKLKETIDIIYQILFIKFKDILHLQCKTSDELVALDETLYKQLIINIITYIKRNIRVKIQSIKISNNYFNNKIINQMIFIFEKKINGNLNIEDNIHIMIANRLAKMQNFILEIELKNNELTFSIHMKKTNY